MTIKNVVIPLETAYLQDEAKRLGVSRTKLVRVVMEKIVRDELVPDILVDAEQALNEPPASKYRRFPKTRQLKYPAFTRALETESGGPPAGSTAFAFLSLGSSGAGTRGIC